eukprot:2185417-Pyramimonas_sp.AAC.1
MAYMWGDDAAHDDWIEHCMEWVKFQLASSVVFSPLALSPAAKDRVAREICENAWNGAFPKRD